MFKFFKRKNNHADSYSDEWIKPGKDQCGNCHAHLEKGDKYCRICGTKAGEGAYEPYRDIQECIYGPPPVNRVHICKKCGFSWTTCTMIDNQKYCPKCGGKAPYNGGVSMSIGKEMNILSEDKGIRGETAELPRLDKIDIKRD